ncbi:hypothetical protein CBL_14466 [Carabus blaptoides fortunei]
MQKDKLIYDYLLETIALRKKIASIENEKQVLQHKHVMHSINIKTGNLVDLLNSCIGQLEKINKNKDTTVLNMKSAAKSTENFMQLSCTYHDDILSMLSHTDKFEKLLDNIEPETDDEDEEKDDFSQVFAELEELNSVWVNKFTEEINGCKLSKKFVKNINQMKYLHKGKNSAHKHKNDSDLGCYPHDSNLVNIDAQCMSQFATSSPILKKLNQDVLLKTPE